MKHLRNDMIRAMREHALGHIEKHRMNVEVYLANPVGIGEHADVMEAIEGELKVIAEYHDQLEVIDTYFPEIEGPENACFESFETYP